MRIEDYGPYNFNDLLAKMEDEMVMHKEAISIARNGIAQLFDELEQLSVYACYLEGILNMHGISYHRYEYDPAEF